MKFKIVFCGPDEDPASRSAVPKELAAESVKETGRRYEERRGGLLRREQLQNGRIRYTALSNFSARIVSDIIRDDGDDEQREFGVPAELGGQRVTFVLPEAEFGPRIPVLLITWEWKRAVDLPMAPKRQNPKTRAALSQRCGSSKTEADAT